MLNKYARAFFSRVFTPIAGALVRLGVSPDVVTIIGTLGVMFGALYFFPKGDLFTGTMVITAFVFSDMIDGNMARQTNRSSMWGAYLDSTMDRFGDAAVFGGLALYYAGEGRNDLLCALAMYNLAAGSIVSYARARAESLDMQASVGMAERADRLVLILVAAGLQGAFHDWHYHQHILRVALVVLAVATSVTIAQRILMVRKQALALDTAGGPGPGATAGGGASVRK